MIDEYQRPTRSFLDASGTSVSLGSFGLFLSLEKSFQRDRVQAGGL
jgi:hypothetical protein